MLRNNIKATRRYGGKNDLHRDYSDPYDPKNIINAYIRAGRDVKGGYEKLKAKPGYDKLTRTGMIRILRTYMPKEGI